MIRKVVNLKGTYFDKLRRRISIVDYWQTKYIIIPYQICNFYTQAVAGKNLHLRNGFLKINSQIVSLLS